MLSQAASFQVHGTLAASRGTSCRLRFGWWGGPNISRRVAASTSGGASRQYSWMQHPSLPRRSAQIDPRRIPEGPVAHGLSRTMVHVRFGSRPPSWPQNEVKVLVDAESSLYSSSIETPGPARPWRENVTRPRSSAGLPRLYPFWIIPSDLFPFLCLPTPYLVPFECHRDAVVSPEPPLRRLGRPVRWLGAPAVLPVVGRAGCSTRHWRYAA